jgi:hypothetical protein
MSDGLLGLNLNHGTDEPTPFGIGSGSIVESPEHLRLAS